jgi:hypothetical protein
LGVREVWPQNFSIFWTYEILLDACLVDKGIAGGFVFKFNDFCKIECLFGIHAKHS